MGIELICLLHRICDESKYNTSFGESKIQNLTRSGNSDRARPLDVVAGLEVNGIHDVALSRASHILLVDSRSFCEVNMVFSLKGCVKLIFVNFHIILGYGMYVRNFR